MSEHELSFCRLMVVDPQIAVINIFDEVGELHLPHLQELDELIERTLSHPCGVISEQKGIGVSLSSEAIIHVVTRPKPAVFAVVSDQPQRTRKALSVLMNSPAPHQVFGDLDLAIAWIKSRLRPASAP